MKTGPRWLVSWLAGSLPILTGCHGRSPSALVPRQPPPSIGAALLTDPVPKVANRGIPKAAIVVGAPGGELAAWLEFDVYGTRLMTARLDASGLWQAPRRIDTNVWHFDLVSGASGILLAWGRTRSPFLFPLTSSLRAARLVGGEFEDPVTVDVSDRGIASVRASAGPSGYVVAAGLVGTGPAGTACRHEGAGWLAPHRFGSLGTYSNIGIEMPESAQVELVTNATGCCVVAGITGQPLRALATVFADGTWSPTTNVFDGLQIAQVQGVATDGGRYAVLAASYTSARIRIHAGAWGPVVDLSGRTGALAADTGRFVVAWRLYDGSLLVRSDQGVGWGPPSGVPGSAGSLDEEPVLVTKGSTTLVGWRAQPDTIAFSASQGAGFQAPTILVAGPAVVTNLRATSTASGFAASWRAASAAADGRSTLARAAYVAGTWQPAVTVPVSFVEPAVATLVDHADGFSAIVVQRPAEGVLWWFTERNGVSPATQRISSAAPATTPVGQNTSPGIVVDGAGDVLVAWLAIESSSPGAARQIVARQSNGAVWGPPVAVTGSSPTLWGVAAMLTDRGFRVAHHDAHAIQLRTGPDWTAQELARGGGSTSFGRVQADATGSNLAVAWMEQGEYLRGGIWGTAPGELPAVRLGVGADAFRVVTTRNRALILSNEGTSVRMNRRIVGSGWSQAEYLDPSTAPLIGIAAAGADDDDDFAIAWSKPDVVEVRRIAPSGFQPWFLSTTGEVSGDLAVALGPDGPLVAWIEDGRPVAAALGNGTRSSTVLDEATGTRSLVVMRAGSGVDVAWVRSMAGTTAIVARRFESGAWSAPVTIRETTFHVDGLALAPAPEGFTLAWEESGDIHAAVRVPRHAVAR